MLCIYVTAQSSFEPVEATKSMLTLEMLALMFEATDCIHVRNVRVCGLLPKYLMCIIIFITHYYLLQQLQ